MDGFRDSIFCAPNSLRHLDVKRCNLYMVYSSTLHTLCDSNSHEYGFSSWSGKYMDMDGSWPSVHFQLATGSWTWSIIFDFNGTRTLPTLGLCSLHLTRYTGSGYIDVDYVRFDHWFCYFLPICPFDFVYGIRRGVVLGGRIQGKLQINASLTVLPYWIKLIM